MTTPGIVIARSLRAARWGISAIFLLNGIGIGLWSAHIPLVRDQTGIDARILGLVLLTMAGGAMAAMPLSGLLTSRFGSRRTTVWTALAFAAVTPIVVASTHVAALFAAAFAFGATNGALDVAMNANAAQVESARGKPTMSSFHAFFSLGGMAGAALGGVLISQGLGGGRGASMMSILTIAMVSVAAPRLLVTDRNSVEVHHFALPRGAAWALGLLALLCMAVEGALVDWSALLLRERTGVAPASAAIGYSAFSVAMAACRFAGDELVVRFGAQRVMLVGGLLIFVGLSVAVHSDHYVEAAAGFALVGLGAANVVPLIFGAAARIPGMSAGTGVATAATVGYAGFLLGPPVIGWLTSVGSVATALGFLSLAGAIIALNARVVTPKPAYDSASSV